MMAPSNSVCGGMMAPSNGVRTSLLCDEWFDYAGAQGYKSVCLCVTSGLTMLELMDTNLSICL